MKYGDRNTFKGRRRWGRHGTGGHKKNKPGSQKGSISAPAKPSRLRYFEERRWIANKAKKH